MEINKRFKQLFGRIIAQEPITKKTCHNCKVTTYTHEWEEVPQEFCELCGETHAKFKCPKCGEETELYEVMYDYDKDGNVVYGSKEM